MNMVIDVLEEYVINFHNINILDLLIDEAQKAQIQSDYLLPLKNTENTWHDNIPNYRLCRRKKR